MFEEHIIVIIGEIHLNELGRVAQAEWLKTPEIRPDMNLELGEFQVFNIHHQQSKKLEGG